MNSVPMTEPLQNGALIEDLIASKPKVKDIVTPEMRRAAEHAVMLRLCDQIGAHHRWDWIVDDVIEALSQTEVSCPENRS